MNGDGHTISRRCVRDGSLKRAPAISGQALPMYREVRLVCLTYVSGQHV
jgi:hypothetical protein